MIEGLLLASYTAFGGSKLANLFQVWADAGLFDLILPLLLIFAIVFGILTQINFFDKNKTLPGFIAFIVSLMAMQFPMVSDFFREIFPRLGVGVGILLIIMIILGLFIPKESWISPVLFGIAVIVLVVILVNTSGALGWTTGEALADNWELIVLAIFIIAFVASLIGASKPKSSTENFSKFVGDIFKP